MKKLATLLLAAGMVVSASAPASAVDFAVDGFYKFAFMTGQTGFDGANDEAVLHRMRFGLTMAASENLSGYFQFQVGTEAWGTTDDTNGHKNGANFRTRQAYIDWKVPGTDVQVRMGRQALSLPADAFGGNGVLCAGWGVRDGVVVTSPVTDWLGLSALWVRTASDGTNDLDLNKTDDFYAVVADAKFDGVSGSVWAAYATIDGNNGKTDSGPSAMANNISAYAGEGKAWWAGFTSTFTMFDPFTFKLSAAYGSFESDVDSDGDQDGWNVQAKASYKTAYGTPVLGAWYFSGDDKDDNGIMPSLGGYFTPTLTYHDASNGLQGGVCAFLPAGNWGVQAGIEDVSFLQGLSHNFHVTYMQGTNDPDTTVKRADSNGNGNYLYLTEDDSLVSFDLLNKYEIYKNLNVYLEASYIISDFDKKTDWNGAKLTEDDWRAELIFVYDF